LEIVAVSLCHDLLKREWPYSTMLKDDGSYIKTSVLEMLGILIPLNLERNRGAYELERENI